MLNKSKQSTIYSVKIHFKWARFDTEIQGEIVLFVSCCVICSSSLEHSMNWLPSFNNSLKEEVRNIRIFSPQITYSPFCHLCNHLYLPHKHFVYMIQYLSIENSIHTKEMIILPKEKPPDWKNTCLFMARVMLFLYHVTQNYKSWKGTHPSDLIAVIDRHISILNNQKVYTSIPNTVLFLFVLYILSSPMFLTFQLVAQPSPPVLPANISRARKASCKDTQTTEAGCRNV